VGPEGQVEIVPQRASSARAGARVDEIRKLLWKITPSSPGTPITPGRRSAGLWKAARHHPTPRAPSHRPWKTAARFPTAPPAPTAAGLTRSILEQEISRPKVDTFN
jgi:hypothetical protein